MRCVAPCRREGIIVENGALALSWALVWALAGAPACLETRPVGDVIGQSPGTALMPANFTPRNRMRILIAKPYTLLSKLAIQR